MGSPWIFSKVWIYVVQLELVRLKCRLIKVLNLTLLNYKLCHLIVKRT
jgi:hypothetical protein